LFVVSGNGTLKRGLACVQRETDGRALPPKMSEKPTLAFSGESQDPTLLLNARVLVRG
jgi:hypothetical protein